MISIPYNFDFMEHQKPLSKYIEDGGKRAVAVWHRRAGKDLSLWNVLIREAVQKPGLYYYFFPTYTQAKKVIWEGMTNDGRKFLDYIPQELILAQNGSELTVTIRSQGGEAIIKLIGTDKYDSIRGTNPIGCVFSEYAFQNPIAWEVVRPILARNGGWAVFNSTPNGKNHFYDLYNMAQSNKDWFAERLSINDTKLLSEDDIQRERLEGMSEQMIQQEYYCSFEAGQVGSFYIDQIKEMREQQRIGDFPKLLSKPVIPVFDLGMNDTTAIVMYQIDGTDIRIVDTYENNGETVEHYANVMKEKGIDEVHLPHDAFSRRMESRYTIAEQFQNLGFKVVRVPKSSILNGIQQVRRVMPRIKINYETCKNFLKAIESYKRDYDIEKKVFKNRPLHDWSSHYADALRYLAVSLNEIEETNLDEVYKFSDKEPDNLDLMEEIYIRKTTPTPQSDYESAVDNMLADF